MSDQVGNPEDRFSHNEALILFVWSCTFCELRGDGERGEGRGEASVPTFKEYVATCFLLMCTQSVLISRVSCIKCNGILFQFTFYYQLTEISNSKLKEYVLHMHCGMMFYLSGDRHVPD